MKSFLLLLCSLSVVLAHKTCCDHEKRVWSSKAMVSVTNTSSDYAIAHQHQGLCLDHNHVNVKGPLGDFFDASAALALHTVKEHETRKTK